MASFCVVFAIILALITTVATIVAFATPNWIKFRGENTQNLCMCRECDCGLWMHCSSVTGSSPSLDNCRWFFTNNFQIEDALPDWYKAVQGLMSCAVATSLLALLIGMGSLCCRCSKRCNPHQAAGAFINLTFLLLAVAIAVFGAKAYLDHEVGVGLSETSSTAPIFQWSFWLALGATGLSLITSIIFFLVSRSDEYV